MTKFFLLKYRYKKLIKIVKFTGSRTIKVKYWLICSLINGLHSFLISQHLSKRMVSLETQPTMFLSLGMLHMILLNKLMSSLNGNSRRLRILMSSFQLLVLTYNTLVLMRIWAKSIGKTPLIVNRLIVATRPF